MLFHTPQFFIFFFVVLLVYFRLPHQRQNVMLLGASYFFYGSWDWRFLALLIGTTAVDYAVGLVIEKARAAGHSRRARLALTASIVTNLAVLGFFKYFGFFVDSMQESLRLAGYDPSDASLWTLKIVLPVGISFYTFQSMSYTVDVYRGDLPASRRFVDFALFVSFFPQLVAGPIERATALLPQIQRPRIVRRADWEEGALLFVLGFVRKVAIADTAGALADAYFASPGEYLTIPLAAGLVLYAFQIYNDFAGYSNMARGTARMLGFTLMRNFHHPYFATSFSDFWRRWHISLSTWLKDYLYIPLGGNRNGRVRTHVNLMLTMLLGGLWHGANWTFVVWGALHGAYLIGQHSLTRWFGSRRVAIPAPVVRTLAPLGIFAAVAVTWIFFRSPDFSSAATYLRGLLAFQPGGEGAVLPACAIVLLTFAIDIPQALADDEYVFLRWPLAPRAALATGIVLLALVSGAADAPFIYFQF